MKERQTVVIGYHFFPHYRGAVMQELADHGEYDYRFVADTQNFLGGSIEPWCFGDDIDFVRAPCRKIRGQLMWQWGLVREVMRRDVHAAVLLGQVYWPTTWLATIAARLMNKRVFLWTIGYRTQDSKFQTAVRWLYHRLPSGLLVYGHLAKMRAIQAGIPAERIHVVYNSLDYDEQRQARETINEDVIVETRRDLFGDPDTPVAICVSRLAHRRRLDLLLEAARLLKERGKPINVLLVGKGEAEDELKSYAKEHGLSVHFYGACYDPDTLAKLLGIANLTVAPGLVGLTAMQSLAYGVPVVTHDDPYEQAPEYEAIVPGRNGDLFRFGDVNDLADMIQRWTAWPRVPEEVRAACIKVIERHYNPSYQRRVIDRAVRGLPSDDLLYQTPTESA